MVTPTVLSAFFPDYYEREKTERYRVRGTKFNDSFVIYTYVNEIIS